ncbi:hypothetical protein PBAL39_24465 [Pedobacter sp. BAL39]|nr:hypothetical protein PBAL39_24465 [Pedobacter sp. BAL39]
MVRRWYSLRTYLPYKKARPQMVCERAYPKIDSKSSCLFLTGQIFSLDPHRAAWIAFIFQSV